MLEVYTAGSRLVLSGFSARSGQDLGKILARSRVNLVSIADEVVRGPERRPKEAKD